MGKLAAVKAMNDVSRGRPVDPEMKTAVRDVTQAQAGDPVAQEKIATMQTQAAAKVPEAVKYAVYATGATVVARTLASNPKAEEQWHEKVGLKPRSTENDDVRVVDAEIVVPGMSSLPDEPLPPVVGIFGAIKAGLAALVLATKDPFQNYREGVRARARTLPATRSAGEAAPSSIQTESPKSRKPDPEAKYRVHPKKDPDEEKEYEVHGDDARDKLVADTKKRLAELVNKATAGDKAAQAKWQTAQDNYKKAKAKAAKGDTRAKEVAGILEATGLFSK